MSSPANRLVPVTGPRAGLGAAVALAFAQAGARAIMAASPTNGRSRRLLDRLHGDHGALDVLVNNAGIIVVKPIGQPTASEFDRVMAPDAPMDTPMSRITYDAPARAQWIDPAQIAPGFVALAASEGDGISGGRFNAYRVVQEGLAAGAEFIGAP